jgi:hypothetical protein
MDRDTRTKKLRLLSLSRINKLAQVEYDVSIDANTIRRVRYKGGIMRSEENKNTYKDELVTIYCAIIDGDGMIAPGIVFHRIIKALNHISSKEEDRAWVNNMKTNTGLLELYGFLYLDKKDSPSTMTTQREFEDTMKCIPRLLV